MGVLDETWESQALNDTFKTSDVPVSINWYKNVSKLYENLYIQLCLKLVGLKRSYSENMQPI